MSYMYGTDGYAQSGAGYSNSAGEWGMFIPGAVPNVVDNISTYVLGQTRTTSIVF